MRLLPTLRAALLLPSSSLAWSPALLQGNGIRSFAPVSTVTKPAAARQHVLRMATEEGQATQRQPWEFGRFVKTIAFFNAPRPLTAARNAIRRRVLQRTSAAARTGCVLVAVGSADDGAAKVGEEAAKLLLSRGLSVRALVSDGREAVAFGELASAPGGEKLEVVQLNWEALPTLNPAVVTGIDRAIVCKAGADDGAGVGGLLKCLKKYSDVDGHKVFSSAPGSVQSWEQWGSLDDVVMGGVSLSELVVVPGEGEAGGRSSAAVFRGTVSPANNGGFASVRSRNASPPWDWSQYDAVVLRVKGDGLRYKFTLYDDAGWDRPSWSYSFDTAPGKWADVTIPFADLMPIYRTKTMQDPPPLSLSTVHSLQLMLSKFEYDGALNPTWKPGTFSLSLDAIKTVKLGRVGKPSVVILARSAEGAAHARAAAAAVKGLKPVVSDDPGVGAANKAVETLVSG